MKINSPLLLSRIVAFSTFILVTLAFFITSASSTFVLPSLLSIILAAGSAGIVVYFVTLLLLRELMKERLTALYKLIRRTTLDNQPDFQNQSADQMFETAQKDIKEWQINKIEEKQHQEVLKNYRRDFTGNISHELKTPLFNIEGFIHTLLDGAMNQPNLAKKYLKKAANNVDRLSAILEDLSIISKFESDQLELVIETFDIKELCRECANELDFMLDDKKTEVIIDNSREEPIHVQGDRKLLRQVIINLLSNSIRYGNKKGTTTIEFTPIANTWLIEVIDNGIGIEEEHLPHLFNRFYRVDFGRSRKEGGSGIGLAIVKHIIEAHGQTVNATSEFGKGSNFSFTLQIG